MQPSEHLELAAFISMHAEGLIARGEPIAARLLNGYWRASKVRWETWMRILKRFGGAAATPDRRRAAWPRVRTVIQQVIVSDVPTRVWAAAVSACDAQRCVCEAEPVARSVLVAHAEARCRALGLLLHTPGVSADDAMRLNRLRRQADRWSDIFVGHLAARHDVAGHDVAGHDVAGHDVVGHRVARFAANPQRAKDFAADFLKRPEWQPGKPAWRLLGRAWRRGLTASVRIGPPLDDRSEDVAAAILECFDPLDLLAADISQPLWLMRFQSIARQTHEMVEQLCEQEFA
jgi:hypothetical protein